MTVRFSQSSIDVLPAHERLGTGAFEIREQVFGRALLDEPAIQHEGNLV